MTESRVRKNLGDRTHDCATAAETAPYLFILTVQNQHGVTSTRSDVIDLEPGATRSKVLNGLVAHYFPNTAPLVVLFFDIQPNRM